MSYLLGVYDKDGKLVGQSTVRDDGTLSPPLDVPAGGRLFTYHKGQETLSSVGAVTRALRLVKWGKDGNVAEWPSEQSP